MEIQYSTIVFWFYCDKIHLPIPLLSAASVLLGQENIKCRFVVVQFVKYLKFQCPSNDHQPLSLSLVPAGFHIPFRTFLCFIMSAVTSRLSEDQEKQLLSLFGQARICLLYKASVHDYTAVDFHARCDRQGPTITVAYNQSGFIFGA